MVLVEDHRAATGAVVACVSCVDGMWVDLLLDVDRETAAFISHLGKQQTPFLVQMTYKKPFAAPQPCNHRRCALWKS